MMRRRSLLLALVLLGGCAFGPRHLEDGHLAYNEAVRASSDKELLLNIVRLRYLDTGTSSRSSLDCFGTSGIRWYS